MRRHELMLVGSLAVLGLTVWGGVYSTGRMPQWSFRGPPQVVCRPLPPLPSGTALVAATRSFAVSGSTGQQVALIGHDGRTRVLYTGRSAYRRGQVVPWPPARAEPKD